MCVDQYGGGTCRIGKWSKRSGGWVGVGGGGIGEGLGVCCRLGCEDGFMGWAKKVVHC